MSAQEIHRQIDLLSESAFKEWLERHHSPLIERIDRLRIIEDDYRLDNIHRAVPQSQIKPIHNQERLTLYRGLPAKSEIRPGDWVALTPQYAAEHARDKTIAKIEFVEPTDIYWAGTDMNEFFYLPAAWRSDARSPIDYLKSISTEQLDILLNGEMASISRNQWAIQQIENKTRAAFDYELAGEYHGPDHWHRVALHAIACSRANGVDPLIPYLFAWVHDSQRQDDGVDPEHGQRAADFVHQNSRTLFSFLSETQVVQLANACELHSAGQTEEALHVQVCWDADRLDLGHVNIEPDPEHLCTPFSRQAHIIDYALRLSELHREDCADVDTLRLNFG